MNNLSKAIYIQKKFADIENRNNETFQKTMVEYNKLYRELFVKGENKFLNKQTISKSKITENELLDDVSIDVNGNIKGSVEKRNNIKNKDNDTKIPKWKRTDLNVIIQNNYYSFYGDKLVQRKDSTDYNINKSFNVKMKTKKNGENIPVYDHEDFYDVDFYISEK